MALAVKDETAERASVIVAATEPGHSALRRTIAGLGKQTARQRIAEVIVVDAYRQITEFELDDALGTAVPRRLITQASPNHSAALHRGIEAASSNLFWLLADDFVPTPSALGAHLDAHAAHPGTDTISIGPGRWDSTYLEHPFRKWMQTRYDLQRMSFTDSEEERSGFFYAGNTMLRADLYQAAGGFDPDFPYDVVFEQDFDIRLTLAGRRIVFVPEALAHHEHDVRLGERSRMMRQAGQSCARLKLKHPEHPAVLPSVSADHFTHLEIADRARLEFNRTRRHEDRETWWLHRLNASFLEGYLDEWSRIDGGDGFSVVEYLRRQHVSRHRVFWRMRGSTREQDGLEQFDTADSHSQCGIEGNEGYLRVRNPLGAPFAYFRSAPGFACPGMPVAIEIRVKDERAGWLWLEYDSTDESVCVVTDRPGAFKRTSPMLMTGDGDWKVCSFTIPDGCWLTRRVNGGDFRVVYTGENNAGLCIAGAALQNLSAIDEPEDRPDTRLVPPPMRQPARLPATVAPRVSIVIPMFMRVGYTLQCLQAISIGTDPDYEVIIVDDASPDSPCGWLATIPNLRFSCLQENKGYAAACNAGARLARGEWIVFLNNDTLPQPGWLEALLHEAVEHPDAGAVGARLVYPATGGIQHAGVDLDHGGWPFHPYRHADARESRLLQSRDVPAVTGACLLTPRAVFEDLDGFDARYVNGVEDIDYCLRLWERGYRVRYCGAGLLGHYESLTLGSFGNGATDRNHALYRSEWLDTGRWIKACPAGGAAAQASIQ